MLIAQITDTRSLRVRRWVAFAPAAGTTWYASTASASYAQMALPGLGGMFLLAIIAAYALVIDIVLLCKGFRRRWMVIVNAAIALVLVVMLVIDRATVAAAFDGLVYDWEARLLGISLAVVLSILFVVPVIQHLELRGQRPRRAVYAAIAVQAALVAIAWALAYFDDHPRESTQEEWKRLRTRGEQVAYGGVAALRDAFEKQHAWGTFESWQLLKGVEDSPLIHGGAPLAPEDRDALTALLARDRAAARPRVAISHYYGFIETKLVWDTLEPGNIERKLPRGSRYHVDFMLDFIDRHGPRRLCSVDRLAPSDRAALTRALATGYTADVVARATRSIDGLDEACRAGSSR